MKKVVKWIVITAVALIVLVFGAFLYFIPPFDLLAREEFIKPYAETVAASLQHIDDPAKRLLAERGRYLATALDCTGCHTPNGEAGPKWDEYLAGGAKFSRRASGISVSRNLTPDPETGLARRTDAEVKRVLRGGAFHDGRIINPLVMPWDMLSNLTEEDRYALLVYLRNIRLVYHEIPEWSPESADEEMTFYATDSGEHRR